MELPKLQPVTDKKKRKILLLSDDLRLPSGIGTISREIVLNTVDEFDWVQLGAALEHPDHGKGIDISQEAVKETGVQDASVKIIPWTGYGDRNILMALINNEKPDAIMHFTDPRYWTWLFEMEREIRNKIPLFYLNIWDDYPAPMYNKNFYDSVDLLMGISKQTVNINKLVLGDKAKDRIVSYVPHGINEEVFRPLSEGDPHWKDFLATKERLFDGKEYDLVIISNGWALNSFEQTSFFGIEG